MRSFWGCTSRNSSGLAFFALALLIVGGLFLQAPQLFAQEGSQGSIDDLFEQPAEEDPAKEEPEAEEPAEGQSADQSEEQTTPEPGGPEPGEANDKVDLDKL